MFKSEGTGKIYNFDGNVMWILPNYFATSNVNKEGIVHSPYFSSHNARWHLVLIPHECKYRNLGLFLWKTSVSNSSKLTITFRLIVGESVKHNFEGELNSYGCFGKWDFIRNFSERITEISKDGLLRFFCKIEGNLEITPGVSQISVDEEGICKDDLIREEPERKGVDKEGICKDDLIRQEPERKGVDRLVKDLKSLLVNGKNSDLLLNVEDHEFKVHRNILSVRSAVFASMLEHESKENITGVVDIPDCSAQAFEVFLSYVYTGKADNMSSDNILDLYYAADKYEVDDLKSECVKYMEENLSIENFCDVMTLSLRHSESDLQKKAVNFFCENVKTIIKTVQWQKYMKDYAVHANELYIKAIDA